jgi:hypothetical protein
MDVVELMAVFLGVCVTLALLRIPGFYIVKSTVEVGGAMHYIKNFMVVSYWKENLKC